MKTLSCWFAPEGTVYESTGVPTVIGAMDVERTPRETRNLLVYVTNNIRHHGGEQAPRDWVDPCSSAAAFDGWRHPIRDMRVVADQPPVEPPSVWLLTKGWRRYSPLRFDEGPAA